MTHLSLLSYERATFEQHNFHHPPGKHVLSFVIYFNENRRRNIFKLETHMRQLRSQSLLGYERAIFYPNIFHNLLLKQYN